MSNAHRQQGYSLIVSVFVISTVLLLVAIVSARGVQQTAQLSSQYDMFLQSQALAEACAEVALLNRAVDPTYTGNESIQIGSNTCDIGTISSSQVNVDATYSNVTYRVELDFTEGEDLIVTRWERVSGL